ncbi:HU family DNA-binding protein [Ralstonia pseudosolanacearum]|uniref:HU family DNA-binding protein n=2 Tax=Ralstonia solanacearum species complex TaxID=3116862 RepID=A0AA92QBB5_RALSL|nr:HU family DNA-binding protein [Ralstonia pseudosolanacearum]QOK96778.1 HU family DNA-binding protein [Ralstonia pseudosolanacearum]
MNKAVLIAHIADQAGLKKTDANRALDAVLDGIKSTLADGGTVSLTGFGSFSVGARPARIGRNPKTGEEVEIAASHVVKFKAGSDLKAAVN